MLQTLVLNFQHLELAVLQQHMMNHRHQIQVDVLLLEKTKPLFYQMKSKHKRQKNAVLQNLPSGLTGDKV